MIEFKNVSKEFNNKIIFENISFEIKKQESIAVVGKSGVGKTTIGRIIAGLENHSSGEIKISSLKLEEENLKKIRKIVGFVFQDFRLFHHMTVLENIIYSPVNVYKQDKKDATLNAYEHLEKLNLYDCKNRLPSELSGGQKQRVAIIRAIMIDPEIIIFDEPTASLDPEMKNEIIKLINETQARTNATNLIITHDLEFAKQISKRMLLIEKNFAKYL